MSDFLEAESGIRQLQLRYADAVWRKDFPAFADCFTEDGEWRLAGLVLRGRSGCVGFLQAIMSNLDRVRMVIQPPLLSLQDGEVTGRTHVIEHNIQKDGQRHLAMGVYYDRFARQDDCWRFRWHFYQLYYLGPIDMSGQFYELADYGPHPAMPPEDEPTAFVQP